MLSLRNYGLPRRIPFLLMVLVVGGVVISRGGSSGVRSKSKIGLGKILDENQNLVNLGKDR